MNLNIFEGKENILKTFKDIKIYDRKSFYDNRGYFSEIAKVDDSIKLINCSNSHKNVFRGFHIQTNPPMKKTITVLNGEICDYFIDLRKNSETFLKIGKINIKSSDSIFIEIPYGYGHAILTKEENSIILYLADKEYNKDGEYSINFNSILPSFEINKEAFISEKDLNAINIEKFLEENIL